MDFVFDMRSYFSFEENMLIVADNFLQETLNNLDKIDLKTIINKFCLTLFHEIDNSKKDNLEINILSIIRLPLDCKEKYTDEFIDFIICLYLKYESFRKLFSDEHEKNIYIDDKPIKLIISNILSNIPSNENYLDFVIEMAQSSTYAKDVLIINYFNREKKI
jgi:hypothetical protein